MFNKAKNKKQNIQVQQQDPNILTFLNGNAVNYPKVKYPVIFLQTKIQKQHPYLQFENYIYPTQPAVIDIKYCCISNFHPDIKTKQINFKIIKEELKTADILILKMQQQRQHPQLIKYITNCLQGAILNQNQQFSLTINGIETLFDIIDIKQNNNQLSHGFITENTQIILQQNQYTENNTKDKYFDIKMKSYSKQLQDMVTKILNNQCGKYLLYGLPGQGKTNIFYWLQQQNFDIQFIQPTDNIQKLINHKIIIADEIDSWTPYQIQTLFTSVTNKILIATTNRPEAIKCDFDERSEIFTSNENKIFQILIFLLEGGFVTGNETVLYQKAIQMGFSQVVDSFSPADVQMILMNITLQPAVVYEGVYGMQQAQQAEQASRTQQVVQGALQCEQEVNQVCEAKQVKQMKQEQMQQITQQERDGDTQGQQAPHIQHQAQGQAQQQAQDTDIGAQEQDNWAQEQGDEVEQQTNTQLEAVLSTIKQAFINSIPTLNNQYSMCSKQDILYFQDTQSEQLTIKLNQSLQSENYQTFLLYGLPGTGKGLFIRYFSNLSNISIITVNSTEIVSPYVGQTELNLKRIFQSKAKIIFFDECDSLLSGNSGSSRRILQTFIANIERHEQIIICATNRPWLLSDQILNRFDNKLFYTYNSQLQSQNMLFNQLQEYIQDNIDENDLFQQALIKQSTKDMTNSMVIETISKIKELMIKQNKLQVTLEQVMKTCQQIKKNKQISQEELDKFTEFNNKYLEQQEDNNSDVESE